MIDGKVLCAVIELEFAGTKATDTSPGENTLLENTQLVDHALQRGAAGETRQSGADSGD